MGSDFLRVLCFYLATTSSGRASPNSHEAGKETSELLQGVGKILSGNSLWSTLIQGPGLESNRGSATGHGIENHHSDIEKPKHKGDTKKPPCSACSNRDMISKQESEIKAARLSMITDLLRDKLRFQAVESQSDFAGQKEVNEEAELSKLPRAVLDQVLKDNSEPVVEDYYAWDKQIIEPGLSFVEECPHLHAGGCYSFNVSDLQPHQGSIETSQLWLHTTSDRTIQQKPHDIVVYQLLPYKNTSLPWRNMGSRLRVIARKYSVFVDNWVQVDLTGFLQHYLQSGSQFLSLAIVCETCYRENRGEIIGAEDGFKPLMINNLVHEPRRREKRSEDSCDTSTSCCYRHLEVDITSLGLHAVFRPSTLNIGHCIGTCSVTGDVSTNHTAFKHLVRMDARTEPGVRSNLHTCCVPTLLQEVDVIKIINGHHLTSTIPNAKVVSCGCL